MGDTLSVGGEQPFRVLLVDDDSMVRGWVRLALEGTPFRVVGEASSRDEATELATRRGPDVLLIDYRLGDATGTELLRELRRAGLPRRPC